MCCKQVFGKRKSYFCLKNRPKKLSVLVIEWHADIEIVTNND